MSNKEFTDTCDACKSNGDYITHTAFSFSSSFSGKQKLLCPQTMKTLQTKPLNTLYSLNGCFNKCITILLLPFSFFVVMSAD